MNVGLFGGKFLPLHQGHVSCIIEASNNCDLLYVVLSHSTRRDMELCAKSNFKYIPSAKRMQWLDQIASNLPNVKVIAIEDNDGEEYDSWQAGADDVVKQAGCAINTIFGSEKEYKDIFERIYPNSKYILLDSDRSEFNISATQIRNDGAFAHWEFIPKVCRPYYNRKVVIVGTESCGKSTLVKKLATHYNTEYVEEYGRTLCEQLNTGQPTEEYYPYIAYGQKTLEFQKNQIANKLLIVDTESTVTQFYCGLYNNKELEVLNEMTRINDYDLWLYLEPDVEWVADGLRIHSDQSVREDNNLILQSMLEELDIDYVSVNGDYKNRFYACIHEIDKLMR